MPSASPYPCWFTSAWSPPSCIGPVSTPWHFWGSFRWPSPPHLPASPHTFVSAHVLPSLPARFPASCASWACPGRCSSLGLCEVLPGGPPPGMTHSLGVCQHMLSSPRPGCSSQRPGPRLSYLCPGAPRTGHTVGVWWRCQKAEWVWLCTRKETDTAYQFSNQPVSAFWECVLLFLEGPKFLVHKW